MVGCEDEETDKKRGTNKPNSFSKKVLSQLRNEIAIRLKMSAKQGRTWRFNFNVNFGF